MFQRRKRQLEMAERNWQSVLKGERRPVERDRSSLGVDDVGHGPQSARSRVHDMPSCSAYLSGLGWRRDQQASRLDLLDPQVLRYWPRGAGPHQTVISGTAPAAADAAFDRAWERRFEQETP